MASCNSETNHLSSSSKIATFSSTTSNSTSTSTSASTSTSTDPSINSNPDPIISLTIFGNCNAMFPCNHDVTFTHASGHSYTATVSATRLWDTYRPIIQKCSEAGLISSDRVWHIRETAENATNPNWIFPILLQSDDDIRKVLRNHPELAERHIQQKNQKLKQIIQMRLHQQYPSKESMSDM